MNATPRKLILTALAVLATGSAFADNNGSAFGGRVIGPVAELSEQERAWLRERWQRLPPEERASLRHELRQNWDDTPPEARQKRRQELKNRLEDSRVRRSQYEEDDNGGYGRGYGSRDDREPGYDSRSRGGRR